jgi:hypothetical protein
MLFCQLQREQVMKERQLRKVSGIQDEETGNLTKELAARWKSLEKEEKESKTRSVFIGLEYQILFRQEVERFNQEMIVYKKMHSNASSALPSETDNAPQE